MTDKKKQPEKKTAHDWARAEHFKAAASKRPEARDLWSAAFSVADGLYGWSAQAYHYQAEPFLITEADYVSAMEAASKFPTVKPHPEAVAPVLGKKFAAFNPLKAHKG